MDRGQSDGGLPPDEVVEKLDDILDATAAAIDIYHDDSFSSMLRIAVAPCSPFSVSKELMVESANLARAKGVRLHTHLAETLDEEEHCLAQMQCTPVEYMEQLGWLGDDVWFAHAVHLHDPDIAKMAATGTGTAHCPSSNARLGAGIARISDLLRAGATVGLGVDGSASAEMVPLAGEIKQAMYMQRAKYGPTALTARQALELGTLGGAKVLGRQDEIGSLEAGKLADIAIWRVDGFYAAIDDPVVALGYGQTPPLAKLIVGGNVVVDDDMLVSAPQDEIGKAGADAHRRLMELAKDVL
jgi:cytosine/adenosine deaminase-related metal-dependent hydrolase